MTHYRIHPAGVKATLTKTAADASELETILKPLAGYVESAATGTGGSGAIVPALSELFGVEEKRVTAMATRMGACLTGAADATKAYIKGDHEMATTIESIQRKAVKAASAPPR